MRWRRTRRTTCCRPSWPCTPTRSSTTVRTMTTRCALTSTCVCKASLYDRTSSTAYASTTSWRRVRRKTSKASYMAPRKSIRTRACPRTTVLKSKSMWRPTSSQTKDASPILSRRYSRKRRTRIRAVAHRSRTRLAALRLTAQPQQSRMGMHLWRMLLRNSRYLQSLSGSFLSQVLREFEKTLWPRRKKRGPTSVSLIWSHQRATRLRTKF